MSSGLSESCASALRIAEAEYKDKVFVVPKILSTGLIFKRLPTAAAAGVILPPFLKYFNNILKI